MLCRAQVGKFGKFCKAASAGPDCKAPGKIFTRVQAYGTFSSFAAARSIWGIPLLFEPPAPLHAIRNARPRRSHYKERRSIDAL